VISCDHPNVARIKSLAGKFGISAESIGETIPEKLEIMVDRRAVVLAPVRALRECYESGFEAALHTDPDARAAASGGYESA